MKWRDRCTLVFGVLVIGASCGAATEKNLGSPNPLAEFVATHDSVSLRDALMKRDQAGYLIPGFGALTHAAAFGYNDVVAALAKDGALLKEEGGEALYVAATLGRADTVTLLLELGLRPDTEVQSGLTPLFGATEYGHSEVACLLLRKGANVNHRARTPFTLLELGVAEGRTDTVRLLLGNGYTRQQGEQERLIRLAERAGNTDLLKVLVQGSPSASQNCTNA